jgi:hypothetical protein
MGFVFRKRRALPPRVGSAARESLGDSDAAVITTRTHNGRVIDELLLDGLGDEHVQP